MLLLLPLHQLLKYVLSVIRCLDAMYSLLMFLSRLEQSFILAGSVVLATVAEAAKRDFVAKLDREWLPGKQYELLYRGTRDGLTAVAFHAKCDGKGPTLVLVRAQSKGKPVSVFGGYAGTSWEARQHPMWLDNCEDAPDSFVFTVVNPFGDGVVRMGVSRSCEFRRAALWCGSDRGPSFGGSNMYGGSTLVIRNSSSPASAFDESSYCGVNASGVYGDVLGRGASTFTGSGSFMPLEVEVWRVI
jgi:hypothetical protein